MTQPLLFPLCSGYPVRKERPSTFEYVAAELWVREQYRHYFRAQGGQPQIITWQYERFYTQYETADEVLDITMTLLESDFRNVFTDAFRRKWDSLLSKNAPEASLLELLRQAAPGGSRKPDMLGIHAGQRLTFDSVEVGTVKGAESTYTELTDKMAIIEKDVVPQIKLRLPALQRRYATRGMSTSIPTEFAVQPSPFRLNPWAKVLPLPIVAGDDGVREVDWICYHPTDTWAPASAPPPPPGRLGTDGMVLYHIHRAPLPQLPKEVSSRIRKELERWTAQNAGVLELNPALLGAFVHARSDWSPEARAMFAYFGIAALVALGVVVAVEAGLIAGAVTLSSGAVALVESAPTALPVAIRGAAALAPRLWPMAASLGPALLPVAARP